MIIAFLLYSDQSYTIQSCTNLAKLFLIKYRARLHIDSLSRISKSCSNLFIQRMTQVYTPHLNYRLISKLWMCSVDSGAAFRKCLVAVVPSYRTLSCNMLACPLHSHIRNFEVGPTCTGSTQFPCPVVSDSWDSFVILYIAPLVAQLKVICRQLFAFSCW